MGTVDLSKMWLYLADLEGQIGKLEQQSAADANVPHEETDLHRVFCDDTFCLAHDAHE